MLKKWITLGIILLFLCSSTPALAYSNEKTISSTSHGTWLYVGGSGPGNYSSIQEAVNNTVDGDTVFVYNDSSPYLETVVINTSIRMLGEEKNSTIIDAGATDRSHTISINVDNVYIENLSIWNTGWASYAIVINSSENVVIAHDIFSKNVGGVYGVTSNHLYIKENNFTTNAIAVTLFSCLASVISNNEFLNNSKGLIIRFDSGSISIVNNIFKGNNVGIETNSDNIAIVGNTMEHSSMGLFINSETANIQVHYNIFNEDDYGIFSFGVMNKNITISQNTFSNNSYGFSSRICSRIRILQNNFIGNQYHAFFEDSWWFQVNRWKGNYWDDYSGTGAQVIHGNALFLAIPLGYGHYPFLLYLPWVNFDWHPAQEPYDIPGMM